MEQRIIDSNGYFRDRLTVNGNNGGQFGAILAVSGIYAGDWPVDGAAELPRGILWVRQHIMSFYQTRSDRRYKKDIHELDKIKSIEGIMKLKPVSYYYREKRSVKNQQLDSSRKM